MKLTVNLGPRSYDVILKRGCLQNAYQFIHLGRKVAVITDEGVPPQYAQLVAEQCRECRILTVKQGETHKNLQTLASLLQQMLDFGMGRTDLVIAVGGGVVSDLAGLAASMYMQGIDFVNCPTTTLAMMDAAIGGKSAVHLGSALNAAGAFHQPKLVLVDPDTLATLPPRHYANGLAEAVKAALCFDPVLFDLLENGDVHTQIETIIYRCLTIQKNLAEQDETQQGASCALYFGHTLGSGIEAVKGNHGRRTTGLYHGECVALGMLPMIENKALQKRTRAVLRRFGLPTRCTYDKERVLNEIFRYQSEQDQTFTLIRVPGLGCWQAERISAAQLRSILYEK